MALTDKLTAIADAIREKTGKADAMTLDQMATEIEGISAGGGSTEEWFNDGNTHIWITLPEGRTSPMLGVNLKGTVTVDWGDGTEPNVLTATSGMAYTPTHEYATPGDYIITLSVVDGTFKISGGSYSTHDGCKLLCHSTNPSNRNRAYDSYIHRVEVGDGIDLGYYTFLYCGSLFSVKLGSGVTKLNSYCFSGCLALSTLTIPNSVTAIANKSIDDMSGIRFMDFTTHTSIPTLSYSPNINLLGEDLEIRVPAALYDEWIAATNWSSLASKIVAV